MPCVSGELEEDKEREDMSQPKFKIGDKVRLIRNLPAKEYNEKILNDVATIDWSTSDATRKHWVYIMEFEKCGSKIFDEEMLEPAVMTDLKTKCMECATPLIIRLSDAKIRKAYGDNNIPFKMCPSCLKQWEEIRCMKNAILE